MKLYKFTSLFLSGSLLLMTALGNNLSVSADDNLSRNDEWKEQYNAILEEFMNSEEFTENSRFDLLDVTYDGIPELFISPDSCHAASCTIYSFNVTSTDKLGEYGSYGELEYNDHRFLICAWNCGQGYAFTSFFRFENPKEVLVVKFYDDYGACPPESTPNFTINDKNVSEEIYRKHLDKYSNNMCTVGRTYSFSDEDIHIVG